MCYILHKCPMFLPAVGYNCDGSCYWIFCDSFVNVDQSNTEYLLWLGDDTAIKRHIAVKLQPKLLLDLCW